MSLVSASGLVGGIKEYMYRGFQQLPIVLAATSTLFTITTGSVAHANLAAGLIFIVPLYTYLLQTSLGFIFRKFRSNEIDWTRSTGDSCNIVQTHTKKLSIFDSTNNSSSESVPSYWLTSLGFFVGYGLSNAVYSLMTPSESNADPMNIEKRKSHAVYTIVALCIFSVLMIAVRFSMMRGCEGRGMLGLILSILASLISATLGLGMYEASRRCGARSSDIFGILSQILPASSRAPHPIVCSAS